jgi:hypothetical protein
MMGSRDFSASAATHVLLMGAQALGRISDKFWGSVTHATIVPIGNCLLKKETTVPSVAGWLSVAEWRIREPPKIQPISATTIASGNSNGLILSGFLSLV